MIVPMLYGGECMVTLKNADKEDVRDKTGGNSRPPFIVEYELWVKAD